jgi:hypothetical protein
MAGALGAHGRSRPQDLSIREPALNVLARKPTPRVAEGEAGAPDRISRAGECQAAVQVRWNGFRP